MTDDVLSLPGAAELVVDLEIESSGVELKGVAGEVRVNHIRGAPKVSRTGATDTA